MTKRTKKQKYAFYKRKYLKDIKKRGLWAANIKALREKRRIKTRRKQL